MHQLGLIQVYTGNGKGKTTAALGLALRACGHNFRVLLIQFLKSANFYGENDSAAHLAGLEIRSFGSGKLFDLKNPPSEEIALAKEGWQFACQAIESGQYDLIILDEMNLLLAYQLLSTEEVVAFLKNKTQPVEIILTGRYAPEALLEAAHLVTEMKDVKGPEGTAAPRQGSEY